MKHALLAALALAALCAPPAAATSFKDFPAEPYGGKVHLPDFEGAEAAHAMFRTRLGEAAQEEANFAGQWVVNEIGCGSGCVMAFAIDQGTGHIVDVPVSGERQLNARYYYRADSRLMKTTWIEGGFDSGICMIGEWELRNGAFLLVSAAPHAPLADCQD